MRQKMFLKVSFVLLLDYQGTDAQGKEVEGIVTADFDEQAEKAVRGMVYFVTKITAGKGKVFQE